MENILELMSRFDVKPMSVGSIMEKATEYQLELNPPYQRDVIWSNQYQTDLVSSIFFGFPIGSLTFVDTTTGYIVLDGKQRVSSILAFREGKIKSPDGFTYKEMCTSKEPEFKHKLSKFKDYNIQVVVFPDMSDPNDVVDPNGWLRQRTIFMRINQGQNLGSQERIYCDNFLVRRLMEFIYSRSVVKLRPMLKGAEHKEQRYSHLRHTQNLLVLAFGKTIDEKMVEIMGSLSDVIKVSTSQLQERLIASGYREGVAFDDDMLKRLGILENVKLLERTCDVLSQILSYDPSYKKWTNTTVRDIAVYCLKKCATNILTHSQLATHQKDFFNVFREYALNISEKGDLGRGTNSGPIIRKRLDVLHSCAEKSGIDLSCKNVSFSTKDKTQAYLESDGKCPVCGRILTDDNSAVDHVNPKSMSGILKIPVVICKTCNLRKSNWTSDEWKHYEQYIDTHKMADNALSDVYTNTTT